MTQVLGLDYDVTRALAAAYERGEPMSCRKIHEDLARYRDVIARTRPDVIIECGTDTGASACWFADTLGAVADGWPGPSVVTIDVTHDRLSPDVHGDARIVALLGNSVAPAIVDVVAELLKARPRVMVALDSNHSVTHVLRELELYAPLVTPGCYLVVEDGFLRWGVNHDVGDPLDALERFFPRVGWTRDVDLETRYGVTLNPAGWWRRD